MFYQQLRIFVIVITLIRLGSTASWNCDKKAGTISCQVTLNDGNDFTFSGSDLELACTRDGKYCARVKENTDWDWKIVVFNDGVFCYDVCPFHEVCENASPFPSDGIKCYYHCQTTAC